MLDRGVGRARSGKHFGGAYRNKQGSPWEESSRIRRRNACGVADDAATSRSGTPVTEALHLPRQRRTPSAASPTNSGCAARIRPSHRRPAARGPGKDRSPGPRSGEAAWPGGSEAEPVCGCERNESCLQDLRRRATRRCRPMVRPTTPRAFAPEQTPLIRGAVSASECSRPGSWRQERAPRGAWSPRNARSDDARHARGSVRARKKRDVARDSAQLQRRAPARLRQRANVLVHL